MMKSLTSSSQTLRCTFFQEVTNELCARDVDTTNIDMTAVEVTEQQTLLAVLLSAEPIGLQHVQTNFTSPRMKVANLIPE
jgi:hypothetical protein